MTDSATYSFLPWLRQGVANTIVSNDQDASVLLRARIDAQLGLSVTQVDGTTRSEILPKTVSLYGPGDVVGVDARAIVAVEPRHYITNFEPNYLPYIEFYDEDFPWRYTPAKEAGERLRPWLALVVLKTDEFDELPKPESAPLASFKLKNGINAAACFPTPGQLWAWAHVHVNRDLASGTDTTNATVVRNLSAALAQDRDLAYSRIVSPRRLEPGAAYHAFLVPSFESGRLAGLGRALPPATVATESAWANSQVEFPYYFRWYFRTGARGDFEYLVRLLKPQPTDKRVGVRSIDVLHPGSNLPPITEPATLNGVLQLGGALRVPLDTLAPEEQKEVLDYDAWDEDPYPHPFEQKVAEFINAADDYTAKSPQEVNREHALADDDPDPVVTLPLYGRWHALSNRLLTDRGGAPSANPRNWVHELNLDPRFRIPAGVGTRVVQDQQEEYMNAAWQQVGAVIEANRRLKQAELALQASAFLYAKHVQTLGTTRLLSLGAPVNRRVLVTGVTLQRALEQSLVTPVVTSTGFRKATRPTGPLAKRFERATRRPGLLREARWVEQVNDGDLHLAPPKVAPGGAQTVNKGAEAVTPQGVLGWLYPLSRHAWLRPVLLVLGFVALLLGLLLPSRLLVLVGVLALLLFYLLGLAARARPVVALLTEDNRTPEAVERLPKGPDFHLSEPGSGFVPQHGTSDSDEARRFKDALTDAFNVSNVVTRAEPRPPLDVPVATRRVLEQLDPAFSLPRRVGQGITIPSRIKDAQQDPDFAPVMAYPEIDVPMYLPLSKLSKDLFLPNMQLIAENSLSLLEPNPKFIEAYMVGVNHEMARELLWREYPTDQRGSCFRQFWDVKSFYPGEPPPADLREKLRDIPPIHRWGRGSMLGIHNQREAGGDNAQLVLVIRGELLKRYPNAVIYAQRAEWDTSNGVSDPAKERVLTPLSPAEADNPPPAKLKTPLFEAKIEPDVYFLGFDLSGDDAKGGTRANDPAGWFFVIKQRPGEARFGLDEPEDGAVPRFINWNNLSWNIVQTAPGACIALNQALAFDAYDATIDQENRPIAADAQARWDTNTNSAMLAYMLYRAPVMVAVHATRMLPA